MGSDLDEELPSLSLNDSPDFRLMCIVGDDVLLTDDSLLLLLSLFLFLSFRFFVGSPDLRLICIVGEDALLTGDP